MNGGRVRRHSPREHASLSAAWATAVLQAPVHMQMGAINTVHVLALASSQVLFHIECIQRWPWTSS